MTDEKPTLLPCPFCGKPPHMMVNTAVDCGYVVQCVSTDCIMRSHYFHLDAWERRAQPPDSTMERMDLERLLAGNYRTLDPQWQPIADKLRSLDSDYQAAPAVPEKPKEPPMEDEREAFEKWAKSVNLPVFRVNQESEIWYSDKHTNMARHAWQARASIVPSAGEAKSTGHDCTKEWDRNCCGCNPSINYSSAPQPAMWPDPHDDNPHAGQCCNRASRKVFGDCPYCGRTAK